MGEAGVGKSRLVYEVIHSHRTQGWRVLESASVSYGKATPYFPVIELLKRYAHVEQHDDTRTVRAKVTGQVLTLDTALQDTIPALLSLLEALPEDHPLRTLDPPQRRQRTLDGLKRVLLRESQEQPLLLVFEDLHWIDTETQALLDSLVESLPTARLLLLVNYRPEYQHGWGSKTFYTQLRLDPLPPASAEELLRALLGEDASLAPLTQRLIARTQGNPFFLEESVRTLVETGVLVGARRGPIGWRRPVQQSAGASDGAGDAGGTYRPAVTGGQAPAPDRRRHWHRGVPGRCCRPLPTSRGGAAPWPGASPGGRVPLRDEPVSGALLHLQARPHARGRLWQCAPRAAAGAARADCRDPRSTLPATGWPSRSNRLAHHALRGEVWDKALPLLPAGWGESRMTQSAYREAVGYVEQALGALAHLPRTARDPRAGHRSAARPLHRPLCARRA